MSAATAKKIDFSIRTKMQITSRLEKSSFLSKQRRKKNMFYVLDRDWRVAEFIKD